MSDRAPELYDSIESAGYHPEAVSDGVAAAVVDERVVDFLVHHEPTFDHDEIRRHVTVVVLTPTRLVVAHTDEHPPDDLLPEPYTSTTVTCRRISSWSNVGSWCTRKSTTRSSTTAAATPSDTASGWYPADSMWSYSSGVRSDMGLSLARPSAPSGRWQ